MDGISALRRPQRLRQGMDEHPENIHGRQTSSDHTRDPPSVREPYDDQARMPKSGRSKRRRAGSATWGAPQQRRQGDAEREVDAVAAHDLLNAGTGAPGSGELKGHHCIRQGCRHRRHDQTEDGGRQVHLRATNPAGLDHDDDAGQGDREREHTPNDAQQARREAPLVSQIFHQARKPRGCP